MPGEGESLGDLLRRQAYINEQKRTQEYTNPASLDEEEVFSRPVKKKGVEEQKTARKNVKSEPPGRWQIHKR